MDSGKTKSRSRRRGLSSLSSSSNAGIPSFHAEEVQEGSPYSTPRNSTPRKRTTPQKPMTGTNGSTCLEPRVEYDYSVQNKSEDTCMHRYSSSLSFSHGGEPQPKSRGLNVFSPTCSPLREKRPTTTPESSSMPAKIRRHRSPPAIKRPPGQYESSEEDVPKRIRLATIQMRKEHDDDQLDDNSVHGDVSFGGACSMVSHGAGPPRTGTRTSIHFMHALVSDQEGRVHGGGNFKPMLDGGVSLGKKPAARSSSRSSGNIEKPSSSARRS